MSKLNFDFRACPFCGAKHVKVYAEDGVSVWAQCQGCGARGPLQAVGESVRADLKIQKAALAWNKRYMPGADVSQFLTTQEKTRAKRYSEDWVARQKGGMTYHG